MIADSLSDIVAKNAKAIRPNNKINSSVLIEEKTLQAAELLSSHSGQSLTRVLSSMLDAACLEFIGLYRELLSKDEAREFDQALLNTFSDDIIFDLVRLNYDDLLEHANLAVIHFEVSGAGRTVNLPLRNKDGCLTLSIPDEEGRVSDFTLDRDGLDLEDDANYQGTDITFEKIKPCTEKSISTVFDTSEWVEVNGHIHWIEQDLGIGNLYARISPTGLTDENLQPLGRFPAIPGFEYDEDAYGFSRVIRDSEWTAIDTAKGVWEFQGTSFRFFESTHLSTYNEEDDA